MGVKKKVGRMAGRIPYTDENMKHVSWCWKNDITVGVSPDWSTTKEWIVEVRIKGKTHADPKRYKDVDALAKMYEYYEYYYNKYNNKNEEKI